MRFVLGYNSIGIIFKYRHKDKGQYSIFIYRRV